VFFVSLFPVAAQNDTRGSSDHPILTRYPGSVIRHYTQVEFDRYPLALAVKANKPDSVQQIEGKITKISYQNPAGRSVHEIYSNYEAALKKAGYQQLFTCEGVACGYAIGWQNLNGLSASGGMRTRRYLTMRGHTGGRPVTVAMSVSDSYTVLHVIESKPMQSGLVTASAAELAEGLDRDGHIAVYAIYFDTGSAALKPESKPALDEIAKLMASRPQLKLHVVGHTDSTGSFDLNRQLSADRAASVVKALTTDHKVAAARLMAHGVGPLAPVATNANEEGRAKNRRVDLVAQ
jgi:outer membrane protein OmpA-like peptidoglycan-associated protein